MEVAYRNEVKGSQPVGTVTGKHPQQDIKPKVTINVTRHFPLSLLSNLLPPNK